MKKRITLLLALVMVLSVVLTACGPNTKAYLEKSEEVSNWPASELKYEANIKIATYDAENEKELKFEIPFKMEGISVGKDKGKIDFHYDFSNLRALAPAEDDKERIPEKLDFTIYVDGSKVIMSKELFTSFGRDDLEIFKGNEKYLALDMGNMNVSDMGPNNLDMNKMEEVGQDVLNLFKTVYGDYEAKFDMNRDGDKFSYEYDTEKGKVELLSFVEYTKAHREALIKGLKPIVEKIAQDDKEEVAKMLESLEKGLAELDMEKFKVDLDQAMETIKGSKIAQTIEFKEDSMADEINLTLNVANFMKMDMNFKGTTTKIEPKEIEMPKDVKNVTFEEYIKTIGEAMQPKDFVKETLVLYNYDLMEFDIKPFIEDGRTLVPARAFLEKIGAEVEWDEENEVVTAKKGDKVIKLTIDSDVALVDGKEVKLDKPAKLVDDARTFVPLRFISETFGLNVEFEDNEYSFLITIRDKDAEKDTKTEKAPKAE